MSKVIIKTYNKASTDAVKKQFRSPKGKFAKRLPTILFYLLAIIGILLIAFLSQQKKPATIYIDKTNTVVIDTTQKIINDGKAEVLNLLEQCESKCDANAINWEDYSTGKNRASFGAYMLKVGTIQSYYKQLNGTVLTDFQSITLASNRAEARTLSAKIIFETPNGIMNWKNCAIKCGLIEKVNFVKQLENKINK